MRKYHSSTQHITTISITTTAKLNRIVLTDITKIWAKNILKVDSVNMDIFKSQSAVSTFTIRSHSLLPKETKTEVRGVCIHLQNIKRKLLVKNQRAWAKYFKHFVKEIKMEKYSIFCYLLTL